MNETFGSRLLRLRRTKNLTQEDIANFFNISPQAVSKWENNYAAPDIAILVDLAELLGVSVDELLGKKQEVSVAKGKDINKMLFKLIVNSADGDKVRINLPIIIIKSIVESGVDLPKVNNKDVLNSIDFKEVFNLIETGVIGKIMEVESADGDIVEIIIE